MSSAIDPKLAPEQIQHFRRDGFLSIPRLLDDQTLEALRAEYDRFISGEIACGKNNRLLGGLIHQVMYPSRYSRFIRNNPAVQTAKEMAAQLAGVSDSSRFKVKFDMLIDKPAGLDKETPWHQDYAYSNMPMTPAGTAIPETASMQFWVALDDVDIENSCMQFVPGLHTGALLPHRVVSGDPKDSGRLLALDPFDSSQAVACPLPAGGCTVHHYGTPHYTGPNTTRDRNRRAYIFQLFLPPTETLFSKIKSKPLSWIAATAFLWLPFLLACLVGAEQLLLPYPGDAKGFITLALWSYPVACAIAAGYLHLHAIGIGRMRLAIIPNLVAIPLGGLAAYLYIAFLRG